MTNSAALHGDYVDLKFIKTRKVCQIVVEIPIEQGSAFVQAFGTPNPATGVPVALARLQDAPEQKADKPKRQWSELSRAEQAGIACEDRRFWEYLTLLGKPGERTPVVQDSEHAARVVRYQCKVNSRANLDHGQMASELWDSLYSDYQRWKMGAAA